MSLENKALVRLVSHDSLPVGNFMEKSGLIPVVRGKKLQVGEIINTTQSLGARCFNTYHNPSHPVIV